MVTLRIFYRRMLYTGVGLIVLLVISVTTKVVPIIYSEGSQGPTAWQSFLIGLLTSSACFTPLFLGYEWLVRNHLWRLFHPELDLNGHWAGTTTYERLERGDPKEAPPLPDARPHRTDIHQDAISIAIRSSKGKGMASWQAEAVELDSNGKLIMAYSVDRHEEKGFPKHTLGYEVIKIVCRGARNRPTELAGSFYHAAQPAALLYSGTSSYNRTDGATASK